MAKNAKKNRDIFKIENHCNNKISLGYLKAVYEHPLPGMSKKIKHATGFSALE